MKLEMLFRHRMIFPTRTEWVMIIIGFLRNGVLVSTSHQLCEVLFYTLGLEAWIFWSYHLRQHKYTFHRKLLGTLVSLRFTSTSETWEWCNFEEISFRPLSIFLKDKRFLCFGGLRSESLLRHAALLPSHQVILSHQGEDMKSFSIWPEASFFGQSTWVFWFLLTFRSEERRLSGLGTRSPRQPLNW